MRLALRKIIEISNIFSPSERTINPRLALEPLTLDK
jgi:hypothetical protein